MLPDATIAPLFNQPRGGIVGEIDERTKGDFLGEASALLWCTSEESIAATAGSHSILTRVKSENPPSPSSFRGPLLASATI